MERRKLGREAFLEFDHVTLRFSGLKALSDVSFSVPEGVVFALIGPNGAGKSTLLNCASRFYTPQTGTIRFLGKNLLRVGPGSIARMGIGRSFQNAELFPNLTVFEHLLLGLHAKIQSTLIGQAFLSIHARKAERAAREHVSAVLSELSLTEFADVLAPELPYGLQKRVDIGRALVSRPKLLLLDEPAAGMNEQESRELGNWIEMLPARFGTTVVMVEHDVPLVMRISRKVAVLDSGKLIALGSPSEIQQNEQVLAAYFGTGVAEHA